MRIVKLSSLSKKERKKVLEEQEERYQQNQQERQRIQEDANRNFVEHFGSKTKTSDIDRTNNNFNIQQTVMPSKNRIVQPSAIQYFLNNNNTRFGRGNIDLNNRIVVKNEDGSISTERSMSFNENGKEILIPTVVNGKIVSDKEAIDHYHKTGEYLGKFNSIKEADDYAENLHRQQEQIYSNRSTWDQIKNIANNRNAITLASKSEIANAKRLSSAEIDAMGEANRFNKIMKNGSSQEKFNAIAEHLGNSIIGGAKQTVGGVGNVVTTLGAKATKSVGDVAKISKNEKLAEQLDNIYDKIVDTGSEINDKATYFNKVNSRVDDGAVRTITGATNTVANVATNALLTAGTGGGATLQGLQVGGSSAQEVLNENKDNINQATTTGIAKGITSYLTEKMFDANILTKGTKKSSIQKVVNNAIESKIKSKFGRTIADKATGIIGENLEEIVEDNVGNLIDRVVNNKKLPEWKEWLNNTSETVKATTLSTAILNLVGLGGDNNQDIEADLRKQNASERDIQKAKEFVQVVTQENMQNKNTDNNVINQENKMPQNQFSKAENNNDLAEYEVIEKEQNNKPKYEAEQVRTTTKNAEIKNKSFEDVVFETMTNYESNEVASPLKNRDMATIGKQTNVNAYQYDNPKVKPYFQEMAQQMGEDLAYISSSDNRSTQKGGGTKLSATTKAMDILHNEQGYSYNQIAQGLQNIIDDKGSENNAISKKIELVIDEQLRNGYTNALGKNIEPNQDYINTIEQKQEVTSPIKQMNEDIENTQENIQLKQTNQKETTQNNNTKGEIINWNEIERPEDDRKIRKHYKSIIESDNTTAEAKSIAKELMKTDTYVPETNKGQLAQADERIMTSSPETELQSLLSRAMNGEKISSVDIAVGERLIQYFSKTGNKQQLQDAIQATAMAGTSAGQTVQALSMLNHQTPQGQATWIQRSVDKMNKELAKKKGGTITKDEDGNLKIVNKQGKDITDKVDLFNLTPEMIDKIMNSENQEQMYKNIDEVYEELGQQVPKDRIEKIDSWRYFSMLANARTHIRNMVGNVAMGKMQRAKDKIAGGIEDVVSKFNPEMERTKTLRKADKKAKEFAKNDFKNIEVQSRLELNESKFKPQSRLQNARRTFKSDVMENTLGRLFDLNDTLLEAEDGLGLKAGYQKALADYLTANKIDVDNITDKQLNKARNYAIQQAKEATFHQANALASWVSQIGSNNWQAPKGKMAKFFVDAVLPFKKTPMNVAKSGVEYSPVGLLKSAIFDTAKLRKGDISVNQYIDNISKGLTGTGIALTGYALAKAGILKASGEDDKDKEKYDEEQGKQSYSIEIAGKTYSLDWLAPTGIPLFVGAETYKLFNQTDTEKSTEKSSEEDKLKQAIKSATNLANAGATAINPMSEMSMISGLTSALSSYNTQDNLGSLGNIMTNAGKSYINQFFPTLMGQVAKTGDEYERTTKSTATGTIGKAVDQTWNQIKNKIPGLRQTLPIKTDIWGNEVKQEVNLPLRAVNNFINPATVKNISTDEVDKELNKLYEVNRNSSLLPDILTKTVQLNKQTYRLTNKEYAEETKKYGQTSHKLIENFIKTSDYNKLTQEQKETAISNIYSYAKEQNKLEYAKKVGEEVKPSTLYTTMKAIEKGGGKQSEYLNYLARTKGMNRESEKNKALANSNYSNRTKEIIYINGTGKDDNLYNDLLSKSNINMTEYLSYKNKVSEKAFSSDKDKNGKAIAGSAKNKVIKYLNNNITGTGNRLLIAGKSYALQNGEKQKLSQYINKITSSKEERIEIYKQLDKNFTVKNGKVYMKVSKK